jgi:type IV pilus assembly protein PilX
MTSRYAASSSRPVEQGMALLSGLLMLLVVTILALSMFRSYGTQQTIAGNVREKQRAFSAAVSAQQQGEFWLSNATIPIAGDCTGMGLTPTPQVCANSPDFATVPWTLNAAEVGVTFTNFKGTVSTTPTQGTYFGTPRFYITDLGQSAAGPGEVYQVDAIAWAGTPDTVAVVESTYLLSPAGRSYDK